MIGEIRKTPEIFIAAALIAGLAGSSVMAAPKHAGSAAERTATKKLNEQQLASAGSYSAAPGTAPAMAPSAAAPTEPGGADGAGSAA